MNNKIREIFSFIVESKIHLSEGDTVGIHINFKDFKKHVILEKYEYEEFCDYIENILIEEDDKNATT